MLQNCASFRHWHYVCYLSLWDQIEKNSCSEFMGWNRENGTATDFVSAAYHRSPAVQRKVFGQGTAGPDLGPRHRRRGFWALHQRFAQVLRTREPLHSQLEGTGHFLQPINWSASEFKLFDKGICKMKYDYCVGMQIRGWMTSKYWMERELRQIIN